MSDPTVEQARAAWRAACAAAGCPERVDVVRLPLADAVGRVTAEPVWATRSSPPYDAAAMDGIAVRAAGTGCGTLPEGAYDVVDTGDALPPGRDAVVMREQVVPGPDGGVRVPGPVPARRHVRSVGEDLSAGELLLPAGHRLGAVDVAAAAAAGALELAVHRPPVVAVLPTGDEVRPLGTPTGPGEVLDTNSLMLAAQARELGCRALVLPVEPDDPARIAAAVRSAAAQADLVVLGAGSSAGRDDHAAAVVRELGVVAVHGVAIRPGHPALLGVVDGTPVLGAPGYPVSSALVFDLFAAPLLAALEGTSAAARPAAPVRLGADLRSPPDVEEWVRVRLARVRGELVAAALPRSAGALSSLVRADALVRVPAGQAGGPVGSRVAAELLRPLSHVDRVVALSGSHDPAVELLAAALPAAGRSLAGTWTGAAAGLVALRAGLCHVAGVHTAGGDAPGAAGEHAVVRLVDRELGWVVAPGDPHGVRGAADLARPGLRYVNRQPGSGTRALLDAELARAGTHPADVTGYDRAERTSLAVAAAVAAGSADCGLAPRAAAERSGLGFVPVAVQPYDLVLDAAIFDDPLLAPLWALLADPAFRAALGALPGCSTAATGSRLR